MLGGGVAGGAVVGGVVVARTVVGGGTVAAGRVDVTRVVVVVRTDAVGLMVVAGEACDELAMGMTAVMAARATSTQVEICALVGQLLKRCQRRCFASAGDGGGGSGDSGLDADGERHDDGGSGGEGGGGRSDTALLMGLPRVARGNSESCSKMSMPNLA